MKTKILNALRTEYANLGLGDKAFDGVASFLVKTITKEEDIDGVIKSEDTGNLLKAFQGESDSLRNRNAQLQRDLDAYKQSHPDPVRLEPPKAEPDDPNKPPKWFEEYLKSQKAEKRQGDLLASVKARLEKDGCTNKGILGAVLKGFKAGDDDTEDVLAGKFKEEYNALYKDTFGSSPTPPLGGGGPGGKDDDATVKARLQWVKQHLGEDKKQ